MTLWRRAPREVYRVYGEDEYLDEDASSSGAEESSTPLVAEESWTPPVAEESWTHPSGERSHQAAVHGHVGDRYAMVESPEDRSRAGRLVGLGLLVGVIVSAAALVALNAAHRPPAASPATVAQVANADGASRASIGADVGHGSVIHTPNGHGSVVHMPNSHDSRARVRVPAPARTREVTHFSTGRPSARRASTRRAGEPVLSGGSAESVSTGMSAGPAGSAQPWRSTTSEPMGSGGQAPATGGEFEFER